MKLLVDTNVILDVVLQRAKWLDQSAALLDAIARGRAKGYVASHAVTTIYYVTARANGRAAARTAVADVLDICNVVALASADFQRALAVDIEDYEDAVQAAAALHVGANYLVTRNEKDFKGAPVLVRSPAEVLPLLAAAK